MGPVLSSLVAPQVVITTYGAARGGRVGFMAALDCSMFVYLLELLFMIQTMEFVQILSYNALTTYLHLAPIFHPKLSNGFWW